MMQVKFLESDSLKGLMEETNQFLEDIDERNVVDIKYQGNQSFSAEELLDFYSVMILYIAPNRAITKSDNRKR